MSLNPDAPSPDDTLTDILADDDAVDELPDARVKEAYVKQKLFKIAHEYYLEARFGRESMANEEYDRLMDFLEDWGPVGVQQALLTFAGDAFSQSFVSDYADRPMNEAHAREVIADVFDYMTDTSVPEDRRVDVIRDSLKSSLRSCGMPRHKIARATVQDWKSEEVGR